VVVIESTKGPKTGNYIEMVGSYNPRQKHTEVDGERVKYWIEQGAQVSDTVHNILVSEKIIEGRKVNVLPKKSPVVAEKGEEEAKASEAEASAEESTETSDETSAEKKKEEGSADADASDEKETEDSAPAKGESAEETEKEEESTEEESTEDKKD
jgi:small subunit ribosomal protein S16